MPSTFESEIDTFIDFQQQCHSLCCRILELFAVALDIDRDWFVSRHDSKAGPSGTIFRMLYYPQIDSTYQDGIDIRAGAHSDYGSITLLFQQRGQPGLEILTPGGQWTSVPVDPHDGASMATINSDDARSLPILVNIGDLLQDWTSGLLKSTKHRVVFPAGESSDRYSLVS
ncbi:hypothetical protein BAUCODRAFT_32120 [Baudoinia panamericana UAMH 10762]|uniref:Fe2OG dioxygenase domain-containing protein n=1 Tax=Baudoinia panamericana (strain UAMH 10762) TaxID=717646 RepID=M2NGJ6_BAUPA|nr:uncharacterized protein BAUCODRAFT_32120 [Baudoinia panamericana UAMH 10762]EMC98120.1 hypothetical protein BAUCODRAFT_32120 [Baudoinia panamericana UAMH 10762]